MYNFIYQMKLICKVFFLKSLLALILSLFMLGSGGNRNRVLACSGGESWQLADQGY